MGEVSFNIYSGLMFYGEVMPLKAVCWFRFYHIGFALEGKIFFCGAELVTLTKGTYMEMEVDDGTESSCDN